jgi:hypothetical protein
MEKLELGLNEPSDSAIESRENFAKKALILFYSF